MQPTYLPWAGYFGLLDYVDLFVLLDNVKFSRSTWLHRNQIKGPNGVVLLSLPIMSSGLGSQLIQDVKIDLSASPTISHLKSIRHSYSKYQFFDEVLVAIEDIFNSPNFLLSDQNTKLILAISRMLGITKPIIKASDLEVSGRKVDLLISICKAVGATEYVSPPGSKVYLEDTSLFEEANITFTYYDFIHPTYNQKVGGFISHLSILDMLFNLGPAASIELIRNSIQNSI